MAPQNVVPGLVMKEPGGSVLEMYGLRFHLVLLTQEGEHGLCFLPRINLL